MNSDECEAKYSSRRINGSERLELYFRHVLVEDEVLIDGKR